MLRRPESWRGTFRESVLDCGCAYHGAHGVPFRCELPFLTSLVPP